MRRRPPTRRRKAPAQTDDFASCPQTSTGPTFSACRPSGATRIRESVPIRSARGYPPITWPSTNLSFCPKRRRPSLSCPSRPRAPSPTDSIPAIRKRLRPFRPRFHEVPRRSSQALNIWLLNRSTLSEGTGCWVNEWCRQVCLKHKLCDLLIN